MSKKPEIITKNKLRNIVKNAFEIWDYYMLLLKVALPTHDVNPKKKLADRLFSVIPNFRYQILYDEYLKAMAKLGFRPTPFRWLCYVIHRRRDFDLDTNVLLVGSARIGKSTDLFDMVDTIYSYRGQRLGNDFTDKHIIWTAKQGFTAFRNINTDIIASDEAYFITDRRESMNFLQVKYLQLLNALASKRNIVFTLIQDMGDLDIRILQKADVLGLIYERGSKLMFAKSHSFPIIKQPILDTETFKKKPYLLEDKDRAKYEFSKRPTFINETTFYDFQKVKPAIWNYYWSVKQLEQNEAITRAMRTYDFLERLPEKQAQEYDVRESLKRDMGLAS